jgi:hypothetical protein
MMPEEEKTTPEPEEENPLEEKEEPPKKEEEEPPVRIPQSKEDKRRAFELRKGRLEEIERKAIELETENRLLKKNLGLSEENPLKEGGADIIEKIRQEVDEKIEGIYAKQESERLLGQFLGQYPEYGKYEGKIRKFMNHPAYAQVPIGFIADGIAGKDISEEGNQKRKAADEEAEETKSGGSTQRKAGGKYPNFWEMSPKDFEAYQAQIRSKGRE